jgi:hypothetical protein
MRITVLATLLLFSLLTFNNLAAENEYEDVIYLKDGSIIRGAIVEEVPGETYKIEIADGSVFVLDADDVERIARESVESPDRPGAERSLSEYPAGHRPISFGINFIKGKYGDRGESFYGAEALISWRLSDFLSPAIGFGYNRAVYESYSYEDLTYNIIPIYLCGRLTYLRAGLIGLYGDCYGGYGLVYASETPGESGGLTYGIGHGLEFGPRKLRGDVFFGYRRQHHLNRAGGGFYIRLGVII